MSSLQLLNLVLQLFVSDVPWLSSRNLAADPLSPILHPVIADDIVSKPFLQFNGFIISLILRVFIIV